MEREQELKEAAERHAKKVCGEYYDLKYDESAIEFSMGELCTDDFKAGAQWEADRDKWISCEDRLPIQRDGKDESDLVLTYSKKGDVYFVTRYCYYFDNWEYDKGIHQVISPITHWQPLPPAQKTQ